MAELYISHAFLRRESLDLMNNDEWETYIYIYEMEVVEYLPELS